MLRFVPDHWLDGLLRPLLMGDPASYLYVEFMAPDWRFALFVALLGIGAVSAWAGHRAGVAPVFWRTTAGFALCFYLWVAVVGNGRYFLWGLLLIGPLLVASARRLPGTISLRNSAIVLALLMQGVVLALAFQPNVWALRPWKEVQDSRVEATSLAKEPAVFLTIGAISHSILVPQFHRESRWTNVGGQQEIIEGMPEHPRLAALLENGLPTYAVFRAASLVRDDSGQPTLQAQGIVLRVLGRYRLAPDGSACTFVRTALAGLEYKVASPQQVAAGFMFCRVRRVDDLPAGLEAAVAPELDDVFARVETRCPRQFPAGNALTRPTDDGLARLYSQSDTAVVVHQGGSVYLKHMRALNPTVIGTVAEVRQGRFDIDCERLPGRYRPPWKRFEEPA